MIDKKKVGLEGFVSNSTVQLKAGIIKTDVNQKETDSAQKQKNPIKNVRGSYIGGNMNKLMKTGGGNNANAAVKSSTAVIFKQRTGPQKTAVPGRT